MSGLASEVRFTESTPTVRRIDTGAVLTLAAVGISERGAIGTPIEVGSFTEFKQFCGGYTANNLDLVAAVQGFFDNGGTSLAFSRTVHCSDPTDPTTKTSAAATLTLNTAAAASTAGAATSTIAAPVALVTGDTLVVTIDAGGPATATFTGTAATRTAGANQNYALVNGQQLTISIDGGAPLTKTFATAEFVAIGAATAAEVVASLNAFFAANNAGAFADVSGTAVRITSNRKGTGSGINVTGGTANAILTFTVGNIAGTGNVSNLAAVSFAEFKTVIEAAVAGCVVSNAGGGLVRITSNTLGGASKVQVGASNVATKLGFDLTAHMGNAAGAIATLVVTAKTDGIYGNTVTVVIAAPTNGDAASFNLYVALNGVIKERWVNLNLSPTDPRYALTIVNSTNNGQTGGSDYIKLADSNALASLASPTNLPAAGTFGPMTGGNDGLVGLVDNDFIGGESVNGSMGMRVFDAVDVDVLIMPGKATSAIHNAMITYAEITRAGSIFCVLDPPANTTAAGMVTYVKSTASLYQLSEYAAIYWPRIKVLNPSKSLYGQDDTVVVPPSGHIAGVYARVDASKIGGAFEHPAGVDSLYTPRNVLGLETKEVLKKSKRELIFPSLINPISNEGGPFFIDGARCLKDNSNFPTVGQRRGIIFVEKKLQPGLAFMRHRSIRDSLFKAGERTVDQFMVELTQNHCFKSDEPKKAFYVDFGPALNTAVTAKARTVYAQLGVATAEPAEFIVVNVSPDTRALDEELAAVAA